LGLPRGIEPLDNTADLEQIKVYELGDGYREISHLPIVFLQLHGDEVVALELRYLKWKL
jgi:hypothetical protein